MTDEKQTQQPTLFLNGKPATKQEVKRILGAKAQKSDKNDRATSKIAQVDRGFKLLR
jgi:hypothetical protein